MPDLTEFHGLDQHGEERGDSRKEGGDCLLARQLRHELDLAFNALGGVAFALLHHRALRDERLERAAQRVYELYAQIDRISAVACVGVDVRAAQ